jgi:hypothetical protein
MGMLYTRKSRVIANVALLALLGLVLRFAIDQTFSVIVFLMLLIALGIVYYGYFLASQTCGKCRESIVDLSSVPWHVAYFFAPFHVPLRCPHCRTVTKW